MLYLISLDFIITCLFFTSHSEVQLFHDDVVLKVRVSSEVEANSVAQFVILERLNLRKRVGKRVFFHSTNMHQLRL